MHEVNEKRVRILQKGVDKKGPIAYWMSRDQRVYDNWALLFTQNLAAEKKEAVIVIFCLVPEFLNAVFRQYDFLLQGLKEVEKDLENFNIRFILLTGKPEIEIPEFIIKNKIGTLVTDFDPLRIKRSWKNQIAKKIDIPFYEVDAHNIVPCFYVSDKEEYGAYTIRPKIFNSLPEFLVEFPDPIKMKKGVTLIDFKFRWEQAADSLKVIKRAKQQNCIKPGFKAAADSLNYFLNNKFDIYAVERNDPSKDGQSNLSPYIHFGQISAQRIALEVKRINGNKESEKSFLEELIVRRELSDNFCFYNQNYDSFYGFRDWAKATLIDHKKDRRDFIYSLEEFEKAATHEDFWNAAQIELIETGKIHGYMRMYWAKKILEWTNSPNTAMKFAVYLNDKYSLDGRDPNGYAGCAWSIGGVHDRAWKERSIFGKIRYMNRNGAKRKFDIESYTSKFLKK